MVNPTLTKCSVDGCDRRQRAAGFCSGHYERKRKYGTPSGGGPMGKTAAERKPLGQPCSVLGCTGVTSLGSAKGFCCAHYMRFKKGADLLAPIQKLRAKIKRISRDGYVVWSDRSSPHSSNKENGMVLEHRAVMAEMIGRPLLAGENVHHKNGKRADNRPSNLELWVTAQPSGQRPQDVLKFAREMIDRYGGMNF